MATTSPPDGDRTLTARKADHLRIAAGPAAQADRASEAIATLVRQLRIAVWAAGSPSVAALGPEHLR